MSRRFLIPDVDPDSFRGTFNAKEFSIMVDEEKIDGLVWPNDRGGFFASARRCPHRPKIDLKGGQIQIREDGQDCQVILCFGHSWTWRETDGEPVTWDQTKPRPDALKVWRVEETNKALYLIVP